MSIAAARGARKSNRALGLRGSRGKNTDDLEAAHKR